MTKRGGFRLERSAPPGGVVVDDDSIAGLFVAEISCSRSTTAPAASTASMKERHGCMQQRSSHDRRGRAFVGVVGVGTLGVVASDDVIAVGRVGCGGCGGINGGGGCVVSASAASAALKAASAALKAAPAASAASNASAASASRRASSSAFAQAAGASCVDGVGVAGSIVAAGGVGIGDAPAPQNGTAALNPSPT